MEQYADEYAQWAPPPPSASSRRTMPTGLLREPGDAVVSGDVASDAAGDVSTSARVRFTESCICARALLAWFLF